MKKLFAFISGSLLISAAVFADVTVKKVDGGKLEATFFYGNPRASEVLLAADFTGFADGAVPMTKTDKGFTYTKVFDAGTSVKYKFIVDGNWTEDVKAPDRVDDGFGGKNGLADLEMLAGGSDMMMGKDGKMMGSAPKITFNTFTNFGFQQAWDISKFDKDDGKYKNDFNGKSTGLNLKSYWKFSGKITPIVPVYVEIAVAERENFENIYKKNELSVGDGLKRLFVDNIFDTIAFYNGEGTTADQTYLGHFKTGVETKYVEWETGYKYAKLPSHKNVDWTTVDGEWEAGYNKVGGYNQFKTGSAFNEWLARVTDGNLQMDIALAPNRSANRAGEQYGFYGYVDATIMNDHYIDFQYNTALGNTFHNIFDKAYEHDIILGYKGMFGPVTVKANGLVNVYTTDGYPPASSDVKNVQKDPKNKIDNVAMKASVTYKADMFSIMAGYRFRGAQANMMYVEEGADDHDNISDQLGKLNHQRIFAKASVTPIAPLTIELKPWVEMNLTKEDSAKYKYSKNLDNVQVSIAPKVIYKISDTMTVDGGFDVRYNTTKEHKYNLGSESYSAKLNKAGVHFNMEMDGAVSSLDLIYGYVSSLGGIKAPDGTDMDDAFGLHSLIAAIGLPADTELQASISFLQKYKDVPDFDKTDVQPFGFSVGANKILTKKYKTTLIGQFVYNIDPHKGFGDGWHNLSIDDYYIDKHDDNGIWINAAALRAGVNIDF